MRIALLAPISHRVPPSGYGPWEQVVADLADGLSALGQTVTVFAARGSKVDGRLVETVPFPLEEPEAVESVDGRIWEELHIAEAMSWVREGEFDLVHNNLSVHPLGYADLLGIPMITTLHGVGWNRATHPALSRFRHLPFVSISGSERHFFPGLNYVATVYNGVDPQRFPAGTGEGGHLLFAGRLAPEKAPHLAIDTARRAGMPLLLAGPVEEKHRGYFEEMVEPSLSAGVVDYLGPVTGRELAGLYGGAAGLLVPLEWDEPFGLVVAEAMMTGTPVIGWRRGALPELIVEGVTGFLVEDVEAAVDATRRLPAVDRGCCRKLAIERLGVQRMATGYEAAYRRVLEGLTPV